MEIVAKVFVGLNPRLNNMSVYRSVDMTECFTPMCHVNDTNDGLMSNSLIKIKYKEWVENSNNEEIVEHTVSKYYVLQDSELWTPVSDFLNTHWFATVANSNGFKVQIDKMLLSIPIDCQNCYVVQLSDLVA